MVLPLMTLLVQLECPLDRMNQLGFDAEFAWPTQGSAGHHSFSRNTAAKDDERYAQDSTEGDNKT